MSAIAAAIIPQVVVGVITRLLYTFVNIGCRRSSQQTATQLKSMQAGHAGQLAARRVRRHRRPSVHTLRGRWLGHTELHHIIRPTSALR